MALLSFRWIQHPEPISSRRATPTSHFQQRPGHPQEGLAFACELHRTYISGVERGIRNPTVVILDKIATALEIPAWRLLDDRDDDAA